MFYFAASRVSNVIRNKLSVKIASLRQAVFKSDDRLRKALSIAEYYDILEETSKVIAKHNTEDEKKHTRKLERDRTDCNHYIPWQSFADVQIRKKRNSRAKKNSPRVSSRRLKRRNIKTPTNTPATEDSNNVETSAPPPVINLSISITLTEGHFGILKKGPKFVPVRLILRSFKKTFGSGKVGFAGLFIMTLKNPNQTIPIAMTMLHLPLNLPLLNLKGANSMRPFPKIWLLNSSFRTLTLRSKIIKKRRTLATTLVRMKEMHSKISEIGQTLLYVIMIKELGL